MNEKKTKASNRSLFILLLMCASTLLVIALTIASAIQDVQIGQAAHATSPVFDVCGAPVYRQEALPDAVKFIVKAQCNNPPASDQRMLESKP